MTALSAHGITVTPGQVVFAIDDQNGMWTHSLDSAGGDEPELRAQARRRAILEEICGVGR